ncbi:hypothetical protein GURKE_00320 [Brevundimonas phage vB_BpoS-Gurke]|uniref:Uncharacterized protein n=1 Tax=Brevundimonas phage vB_BpoS-Gurke TaxID=2948599 RepID=A0A9E7N466_9CAUD|nr:hypothetical protein GURKE_00320 [Brevundimonas phage vB_BpoS-Gurke]
MLPKEARPGLLLASAIMVIFPLIAWASFEAGKHLGPFGGMLPCVILGIVGLSIYGGDALRRHHQAKHARIQATHCTCGAVQVVSGREIARRG